ncbi:MAG TPA: hypothetical protein VGL88_08405 [Pseudonocardiaceae bacterium]|jgi:hypothetical protein
MTTAQDTITENNNRAAELVVKLWQPWADTAQKFADMTPAPDPKLMDARASNMENLIDSFYDSGVQVMSAQREILKSCVALTKAAVTYAMISTQNVAKTTATKKS